jgi:GTP-binding protein
MADIPGIIEGASEGAGLGYDFLRHIDRCRLLVHLVDVSGSEGRDPVEDFDIINAELKQYSPELATRPMLVCGNKTDLCYDSDNAQRLKAHVEELGYTYFDLSAATHTGVKPLINKIAEELSTLPPVKVFEANYTPKLPAIDLNEEVTIETEDHFWFVEAKWLEHMVACTNFKDFESRNWFDRQLREAGLFDKLEAMGIQDGDTVVLYDLQFEYQR